HQDFDALLKQFETEKTVQPTKIHKMRALYYYLGAAAAAVIGLLVYFNLGGADYTTESAEFFAARDFVTSPIESAKPQFTSYKINANKGGVYEYRSGSRLVVPSAAFVDDRGKLVEGDVEIKYREYHDYIDFYLSGIPMTYDSASTIYNLESAGMMEIYAEKDGQKVKFAPGKSIDVELHSAINAPAHLNVPPNYNIYKLDTENRKWVYQRLDNMELVKEAQELKLNKKDPLYDVKKAHADNLKLLVINEAKELTKVDATLPKPSEPLKPKKATRSDNVFNMDFNDLNAVIDNRFLSDSEKGEAKKAESDLAGLYQDYEQMLWKVSPKSSISAEKFAKEYNQVDGITIDKYNARDYEFTLINGTSATKVIVTPVLTGKDYEKALATFNQQFAKYSDEIKAREVTLAGKKETIKNRFAEEQKIAEAAFENDLVTMQAAGNSHQAIDHIIKRKVVNRFKATEMGIWNCDRPIPPFEQKINARFIDKHGNKFDGRMAYLVDKSRNTIIRFYTTDKTPINYNKNSDNLLWLLTTDNKIAVFRPDDFKRINKPKGNYEFEMVVIDKEIKNEADVRKVLHF
ncbi:MAG: hypothetical protein ACI9XO_002734, partial [Paraglaciecola sp.]